MMHIYLCLFFLIACICKTDALSYQVQDIVYDPREGNNAKVILSSLQYITINTCDNKNFTNIHVSCSDDIDWKEQLLSSEQIQKCDNIQIQGKCFNIIKDIQHESTGCDEGALNQFTKIGDIGIVCTGYSFPTDTYSNILDCRVKYTLRNKIDYYSLYALFAGYMTLPLLIVVICASQSRKPHGCIITGAFVLSMLLNFLLFTPLIVRVISSSANPNSDAHNFAWWLVLCLIEVATCLLLLNVSYCCINLTKKKKVNRQNQNQNQVQQVQIYVQEMNLNEQINVNEEIQLEGISGENISVNFHIDDAPPDGQNKPSQNPENLVTVTYKEHQTVCTICTNEYKDGDIEYHLKCTHVYHKKCLDDWLKVKKICPTCNADIITN
jgi:hypothetical protein